VVAWRRPRIIGPEVARFAAQAPASASAAPGAQAPAGLDELLALLAGDTAGRAPAPATPATKPPGTAPAAPAPADPLARVAAALVRIGRGAGTAADSQAVCAAVSCTALGGPPDRAGVNDLFAAIDGGLVGPAEAAAATGLSRAEAGRLLTAIEAARGA
jgi:hypothetical protein